MEQNKSDSDMCSKDDAHRQTLQITHAPAGAVSDDQRIYPGTPICKPAIISNYCRSTYERNLMIETHPSTASSEFFSSSST